MDLLRTPLDRRTFLQATAASAGAAAIASALPRSLVAQSPAAAAFQVTSPTPTLESAAKVLVKDVVDFQLHAGYQWNGGSVTFKLHEGWVDGLPVHFIRTDTSDQSFAEQEGLVFVPLLAAAKSKEGALGRLFLFEGGAEGQMPVLSTAPGYADFTPLLHVHLVTLAADAELLDSASAVEEAAAAGTATVAETGVVVNYPSISLPGGELPVDTEVTGALSGGPLLSAPDLDAMTVKFKLHQCYPGTWYIVTDTSAVPMAPMMNIQGSPGTAGLAEVGAASTVTVFGNGLTGPGAMGFQPAIFREASGEPSWSPQWNHFTPVWKHPAPATLVLSQAELDALLASGAIELFVGTPDTGGKGFVVNCPAPITAPNDFTITG
ncbi:MAG: twin-arginine translocation signal domain-containing protein [Chloroflexi bacterium]|nr:twin-arginine translocation signal domain-containing protein [Chloroflexota bacterium]